MFRRVDPLLSLDNLNKEEALAKRQKEIEEALPLVTRVTKTLNEIVKLDLFQQVDSARAKEIWNEFHR